MSQTITKNKYLANFILDTRNFDQPVETIIEKITSVIDAIGGEVAKVKNLGQKDFVRITDRKFPAGIYLQFDILAPSTAPAALQEKFALDKSVDRIMVLAQ